MRPLVELTSSLHRLYTGVNERAIKQRRTMAFVGISDDQGHFLPIPGDSISGRYVVLSVVGSGTFGVVVKCIDLVRKEHVAVKVVRARSTFAAQALKEIRILKELRRAGLTAGGAVIRLKKHFTWSGRICLVFELLTCNLYELLKRTKMQGVSLPLVRKFGFQLCQTLKSLQSFSESPLIHRDIKPENIMLISGGRSGIRLIDFGSSSFCDQATERYIQSRFYRAPEVIFGSHYNEAIDVWSVGCVLGELLCGDPLFPGTSERDQIERICAVCGPPPAELVSHSDRWMGMSSRVVPHSVQTNLLAMLSRKISGDSVSKEQLEFVDLLAAMLKVDPTKRAQPAQLIAHPFFAGL